MLRFIWVSLVPGNRFTVIWWCAWIFIDAYLDYAYGGRTFNLTIWLVLLALNLYSMDYQRRRRAGEKMP